jgi:hypothetical protein
MTAADRAPAVTSKTESFATCGPTTTRAMRRVGSEFSLHRAEALTGTVPGCLTAINGRFVSRTVAFPPWIVCCVAHLGVKHLGYFTTNPASMDNVIPVTNRPESPHRYSIASVTSLV